MPIRARGFYRHAVAAAFFAGAGCILACSNGRQPVQPPPAPIIDPTLQLGEFKLVDGTDVFRAALTDSRGYLKSSYLRTRNIAFLDASGDVRWLLPDNNHLIEEYPVYTAQADASYYERKPPRAFAVLIKPADRKESTGALLLFDAAGRHITSVADSVLDVCGVGIIQDEQLALIYKLPDHYVRAVYDATTLAKRDERPITIPKIP